MDSLPEDWGHLGLQLSQRNNMPSWWQAGHHDKELVKVCTCPIYLQFVICSFIGLLNKELCMARLWEAYFMWQEEMWYRTNFKVTFIAVTMFCIMEAVICIRIFHSCLYHVYSASLMDGWSLQAGKFDLRVVIEAHSNLLHISCTLIPSRLQ